MATKAELTAMKTDLGAEINEVKANVVSVRTELKADMAELKAEIGSVRSDMTDLKADLKAENAEIRADIREIRQLRTIMAKKTWAEIEVQPIGYHIATRDVVVKCYSMTDSGEVCCGTETLECHNWLESECVRLAQRYIDREFKGAASGAASECRPAPNGSEC